MNSQVWKIYILKVKRTSQWNHIIVVVNLINKLFIIPYIQNKKEEEMRNERKSIHHYRDRLLFKIQTKDLTVFHCSRKTICIYSSTVFWMYKTSFIKINKFLLISRCLPNSTYLLNYKFGSTSKNILENITCWPK